MQEPIFPLISPLQPANTAHLDTPTSRPPPSRRPDAAPLRPRASPTARTDQTTRTPTAAPSRPLAPRPVCAPPRPSPAPAMASPRPTRPTETLGPSPRSSPSGPSIPGRVSGRLVPSTGTQHQPTGFTRLSPGSLLLLAIDRRLLPLEQEVRPHGYRQTAPVRSPRQASITHSSAQCEDSQGQGSNRSRRTSSWATRMSPPMLSGFLTSNRFRAILCLIKVVTPPRTLSGAGMTAMQCHTPKSPHDTHFKTGGKDAPLAI